MDTIQKKALFSLLDSIEKQVETVKSLLMMNAEVENADYSKTTVPKSSKTEYLDDEEESQLDKDMESARLALVQEQERVMKQWDKQRQIIDDEATL